MRGNDEVSSWLKKKKEKKKGFFPSFGPCAFHRATRIGQPLARATTYLTRLFGKRSRAVVYLPNRLMILFKRDRSERPPSAEA